MLTPVAVINALPIFRFGMFQALEAADFLPCEVGDVVKWASRSGNCAVVCAIHDESDLDVVVDLSASAPDAVVLTLVRGSSANLIRESLRVGARSSAPLDAEPDEVVFALTAAMEAKTVLPADIAHELAVGTRSSKPKVKLEERDEDWLQRLAAGSTVADLAEQSGYSTREMFRILANLYRRMGVRTRTEALITASRWGIV